MSRLTSFFRGTTEIAVKIHPEEFINFCVSNDIPFGKIKVRDGKTHAVVFSRDAGKFKEAGRMHGLPEIAKRAKRRTALAIFLPVCAIVMLCLSFFVWDIDVSGNESISDAEILKACAECGIDIGTCRFSVNSEKCANQILCKIPELAWFAVNITGSRAHVLVSEETPVPEFFNSDTAKSVVASKSGTILKETIFSGTPLHKKGETVSEGEVLVSPDMALTTGEKYACCANAEIIAETQYELSGICPKNISIKSCTGRTRTRYALLFGRNKIKLFGLDVLENSDKSVTVRQLSVFGAAIPVSVEKTVFSPYTLVKATLSDGLCTDVIKTELSRILRRNIGAGEIESVSFEVEREKDAVSVTLHAKARENIAVVQE